MHYAACRTVLAKKKKSIKINKLKQQPLSLLRGCSVVILIAKRGRKNRILWLNFIPSEASFDIMGRRRGKKHAHDGELKEAIRTAGH